MKVESTWNVNKKYFISLFKCKNKGARPISNPQFYSYKLYEWIQIAIDYLNGSLTISHVFIIYKKRITTSLSIVNIKYI